MDLESVAEELYALPVDEFIPIRNSRVKEARAAKDRELADVIGTLRKPSTSAWVVNLLARERSDLVDQLLELGEALRSAQETLSGPELRTLSTQRHRVIASIVGEARKLAAKQGVRVSDAIERELEATLDAALADPSAADAVRAGRLSSALSYAGLGSAPSGSAQPPARPTPRPKPARRSKPDADAERREQERRAEERRRAEEALHAAETAASEARSELADARAAHEQATAAREEADQHVADLTAQLEQAQADVSARSSEARDRKRTVQRAEQHAQEAQRRVERARSALG